MEESRAAAKAGAPGLKYAEPPPQPQAGLADMTADVTVRQKKGVCVGGGGRHAYIFLGV